MAGPKINPKAFELDKEMFKLKPQTTALIVVTLLLIIALYAKFW
jgi:SSS family solute:Na+ symporter